MSFGGNVKKNINAFFVKREKLDQQEINGLIKKFTSFQADQRVLCFNLNILTGMSAKTV